MSIFFKGFAAAQDTPGAAMSPQFHVGEKLTYNVSFGKYTNAAYLDTTVVSTGKLSGHDVVELHSRLKMLGFVSAAFFQLDEVRTVYVAPDTGLPIYVSKTTNYGVSPKETIEDYLREPTSNFDLLSLIFRVRNAGGTGTFRLFEDGQVYNVTLKTSKGEKIKTEAGEFDTVVSTVESDYLSVHGIKQVKIDLSSDDDRIPVRIRVKMDKEIFVAVLATAQYPKAPTTPTPVIAQTPIAVPTPAPPRATPTAYIENQPIAPELGFAVGESQIYKVTDGGKSVATLTLAAKERKMFQNEDSLLLSATITGIEPGNGTFVLGDSINAQVDPETLAPRWVEYRFAGALKYLNRVVTFDHKTGNINFGDKTPIDAPIGTHSILSLIYAMRSFNLSPSKDPKNPVNDTRVAVFWETQQSIFTLLPSNPEELTINGEKLIAQMISITTGNPTLDKGAPKVWLNSERLPVRFNFGSFQAELVAPPKNPSK